MNSREEKQLLKDFTDARIALDRERAQRGLSHLATPISEEVVASVLGAIVAQREAQRIRNSLCWQTVLTWILAFLVTSALR